MQKTTTARETPRQAKHYTRDERGFAGEDLITDYLTDLGHDVMRSEAHEDIHLDIDIYLDGVPTSIKTQHAGVKYKNFGLELASQIWTSHQWTADSQEDCAKHFNKLPPGLSFGPGWRPAWWYTGEARQYLILRGTTLSLHKKASLRAYIERYGFSYCRGLSWHVLKQQTNRNAVCGYLKYADVPKVWEKTVPQKYRHYLPKEHQGRDIVPLAA